MTTYSRFPRNDIMSLVDATFRHELGESVGPDLRVGDLLTANSADANSAAAELSDAELSEAVFPDKELSGLSLGYGSTAGDPRLREMLAERHGVAADQVVITNGGIHANLLLAIQLCGDDSEVVTTSPLFPMTRNAYDAIGARVRVVPLTFDTGYRLDPDDVRGELTEKTVLVSLATPQNPSGVAISDDALRGILAAMTEICPDAYLLVDETYRIASYGDEPVADSAVRLSPRVVSVASLSKCHGAAGLRIGWAISTDTTLIDHLVVGKYNTVISNPPITEALAVRVFEREREILADRRKWLADGVAATAEWAAENSDLIEWIRPAAGALCCARLRPDVFDDAAVDRFYANAANQGVRVANGGWFGESARVFRLGFGFLPLGDLNAALTALTKSLRE